MRPNPFLPLERFVGRLIVIATALIFAHASFSLGSAVLAWSAAGSTKLIPSAAGMLLLTGGMLSGAHDLWHPERGSGSRSTRIQTGLPIAALACFAIATLQLRRAGW